MQKRSKEVDMPLMVWYDKTIETSKPNSKGEQRNKTGSNKRADFETSERD